MHQLSWRLYMREGYTQKYVSVVDSEIPSTYELEKCKLLNKIETELGSHYMISYSKEPLENYPYVLNSLSDCFKRVDGEYTYKGNLVDREKVTTILKQRYYALVLTCVTMESISASYKVLEFGKEDS